MYRFHSCYWCLVVFCCLMSNGCDHAEKGDIAKSDKTETSAETDTRVRYVCAVCGGWREADRVKLVTSLMEGAPPDSEEQKTIDEAKQTESPFMIKHIKKCGRRGGMVIKAVYPDTWEWNRLDPKKREE